MKRVLKKAVAFVLAAAAAMSVTVTGFAASAGKRIANDSYERLVDCSCGVFLTSITYVPSANTVVCISDSGETTKVKIDDAEKVESLDGALLTGGSYNCMLLNYSNYTKMLFTNGKIVTTKGEVFRTSGKASVYEDSTYKLYSAKGKVIASIPDSAIKGFSKRADIRMEDYSTSKKAALFCSYEENDYGEHPVKWWIVRNGKTVKNGTFEGAYPDISFTTKNGIDVVEIVDGKHPTTTYYSAVTGKVIKDSENSTSSSSSSSTKNVYKKYSWKNSSNPNKEKIIIYNPDGKKVYSINKSKVYTTMAGLKAEVYTYQNCALIITQSNGKLGCICVK